MVLPESYFELDVAPAEATAGVERNSVGEFLLRCLLGARSDASAESNDSGFDEDVNVYVVGLLQRFMSSEYHTDARRYFYATDLDLAREVAEANDERFRYRAYRINADQLLLGIGLFNHVEGHGVGHDPVFGRSESELGGRGATYYNLASSSLRRLRRRATAPELAMTKLADRFDHYTRILRHLRTGYFRLTTKIGEGSLFHLASGDAESRSRIWDQFLDSWSEWKREDSADTLRALRDAVQAVREIDPEFSFELPDSAG